MTAQEATEFDTRSVEQAGLSPGWAGSGCKLAVVIACTVLALLGPGAWVSAQCNLVSVATDTFNGTQKTARKLISFTDTGTCVLTASSNVVACVPISTAYSAHNYLFQARRAMTAAPTAFCQWGCPACTIRIDQTDGLPVELMEFTIDGSEAEGEADNPDESSAEAPEG